MGHKPDIRTVDPHAEGIRGNDNVRLTVHEGVLGLLPLGVRHAGMVSRDAQAQIGKRLVHLFHLLAGGTINNARLVAFYKIVQPLVLLLVRIARSNPEMQILPGKTAYNGYRIIQMQMLQNIVPHSGRSRGRQGCNLWTPHGLNSAAKLQIIRTEIMPPLAQAMSLIHGNHVHVHSRQGSHESLVAKAFRSYVHQLVASFLHAGQAFLLLRKTQGTVDHGRGNAFDNKGIHLVLHQGNQRTNHQAHAFPAQSGKLVAQGLAAPGRHYHQNVAALHDGSHHAVLPFPQPGKPEVFLQCLHGRSDQLEPTHLLHIVCHRTRCRATPFPMIRTECQPLGTRRFRPSEKENADYFIKLHHKHLDFPEEKSIFSSPLMRYTTQVKAPVAQLDRASDYGSEGLGFESLRACHLHHIR